MTDIVTVYGLKFAVESQGFVSNNAEADRDKGIATIEAALLDWGREEAAAIHADALKWVADDCQDDEPERLERLAQIAWNAATEGWRKTDAAYFSVSAIA